MGNHVKYPLLDLQVGESFTVAGVSCNTARSSVTQFVKRFPERRFSVTKCALGALVTRRPDASPESKGGFDSYVLSADGSVSYFGPATHREAQRAIEVMRERNVDANCPVVTQAPSGAFPDGYLNDWVRGL